MFSIFLSCCTTQKPISINALTLTPFSSSPTSISTPAPCPDSPGEHLVFSIIIDGKDVGRQVRTDRLVTGPYGSERLIVSHGMTRMKMGNAHLEKKFIHVQRTESDSGRLLRASYVSVDQVSSRVFLSAFNGTSWERLVETTNSVSDPLSSEPSSLSLSGDEVVGFRINDILRDISLGSSVDVSSLSYYEPLLDVPISLRISDPLDGFTKIDGQTISGVWIEAKRSRTDQVVIRSFFDKDGTLWVEEYPEIHQVLKRIPGSLPLALETSELLIGLFSDAYISNPNSASRAKFLLTSSPDRLDSLELLDIPVNQHTKRLSPTQLSLEIAAGSPDGDDPPTAIDLSNTEYIQPDAKPIRDSLRYLRTAGKRGRLSKARRYNAVPVIARSSLIQNPSKFWRDPDKVAGIIMNFVSALLPNKHHSFSMSNSVTTLKRGAGDCTEHAVLFASLMRASKIPTRLVTGIHLTRGGIWSYHMWNSYWNGTKWRSIDPSTMAYRPGALHVALGKSTPRFVDVRDRLADFMWKTFSGVTFNLVEASNHGELLLLSRPRKPGQDSVETALSNAVVLSERGNHRGAIAILDSQFPKSSRPLAVRLMRVEFLVFSGQYDLALNEIASTRKETSDSANLLFLDNHELTCLIGIGDRKGAKSVFKRIDSLYFKRKLTKSRLLLKSRYLFGLGNQLDAIDIIRKALQTYPRDSVFLKKLAEYISTSRGDIIDETLLNDAFSSVKRASMETHHADYSILSTWARLLIRTGRFVEAYWMLDHALILAPDDRVTQSLRESIPANRCTPR